MSISKETAEKYKDEYAIICCRLEEGSEIIESNIEDPTLIPDFEESGLLEIPENCLKIHQVIGAKLSKTVDALTPLTPEVVEDFKEISTDKEENIKDTKKEDKGIKKKDTKKEESKAQQSQISENKPSSNASNIKIHIGEGKDINIEIPFALSHSGLSDNRGAGKEQAIVEKQPTDEVVDEPQKVLRTLKRKHLKIDNIKFSRESKIEGTTLFIREDILNDIINKEKLVVEMDIDVITRDRYNEYSNTIMDIQPIATKEEGAIGEGVTRIIDGLVVMLTGTDEDDVQIGEFGSSEGSMEDNIMWNRPGAPDFGDIILKIDVTIKSGKAMERPGPMAAHKAADMVVQEIREALKLVDDSLLESQEKIEQIRRPGKKKVVIVKEIMGQGAMHDNYIMPNEPVGVIGAKANVDLGNVPVVVNPLQVLDGCIHALTCIGPASKETSRHYFREPLVVEAIGDEEIDLAAVVFVGSPQANFDKFYVSNLLGNLIESMDIDGAIVTTEGFGNNHVDFASHIEQIGMRDIPVVGMTFAAIQGQLVVGNKYMDAMIDLNKSSKGIENEILSNNCLCKEDAIRALYMLKAKMSGGEIIEAERKYNVDVKNENLSLIEKKIGKNIKRVKNESSLKNRDNRNE